MPLYNEIRADELDALRAAAREGGPMNFRCGCGNHFDELLDDVCPECGTDDQLIEETTMDANGHRIESRVAVKRLAEPRPFPPAIAARS